MWFTEEKVTAEEVLPDAPGSLPATATAAMMTLGTRGGSLGGTAAGGIAWMLLTAAVPDKTFNRGWWWLLPVGGAFVGSASTAGYLWAGEGFRRRPRSGVSDLEPAYFHEA